MTSPTSWNFADVWEAVAEVHPERIVPQGDPQSSGESSTLEQTALRGAFWTRV